jgi:hypothetical protein
MGTKFLEAVSDKHGIGGNGEYFGDNDAHLNRTNVLYHGGLWRQVRAPRGALQPRARLDRRCNPKSLLGENFSSENLVNHTRGQKLGQRPLQKGCARFLLTPPVLQRLL